MSSSVLKIEPKDDYAVLSDILTPGEMAEFSGLSRDPSVIGFAVFDPDGEMFLSQDIEELAGPVYANVFDMAERLGRELGQRSHRSITFESGDLEVACIRWSKARIVLYRTKGGRR